MDDVSAEDGGLVIDEDLVIDWAGVGSRVSSVVDAFTSLQESVEDVASAAEGLAGVIGTGEFYATIPSSTAAPDSRPEWRYESSFHRPTWQLNANGFVRGGISHMADGRWLWTTPRSPNGSGFVEDYTQAIHSVHIRTGIAGELSDVSLRLMESYAVERKPKERKPERATPGLKDYDESIPY